MQGLSLHGGIVVGVGDVDPKTGSPNPESSVGYASSENILTASAPGVDNGVRPTAAEVAAVRHQELLLYSDPVSFLSRSVTIISLVDTGRLGVGKIAQLL